MPILLLALLSFQHLGRTLALSLDAGLGLDGLNVGLNLGTASAQGCTHIPDELVQGPVRAEAVMTGTLDGPKLLSAANDTTYDWWYFDAVSASTNASVTIIFFNTGPDGFIGGYLDGPLTVSITGSFANGSTFASAVPASGGATVTADNNSVSGTWKDTGFAFQGTSLQGWSPTYTVTIDAPAIDIFGNFTLASKSPSHLPCGRSTLGMTEDLLPHVFWANAVPDASANVQLTVSGTEIMFSDGVGYHDKNWGDQPFASVVSSWYWGHSRVGPYSVVWFDAIDKAGGEHFSAYVAKDGNVVSSSCEENVVQVRPWGRNSQYPPTSSTGVMQGLEVVFRLPDNESLRLNVTTELVLVDIGVYVRATGSVSGADAHGSYDGLAMLEVFKF